jgi:hypothetical protein
VHPAVTRESALALIAAGANDCEVARRLGIARTTVRDWRRARDSPGPVRICPRCWRPSLKPIIFADADYAELLGLYLGDGHIVRTGRSDRLRLFLDTRYTGIIADAQALLRRCFPEHRVGTFRTGKGSTTIISVYCTHLACLFPQHGPGRKHRRAIALEQWQTAILEREPWRFLRGCIRSDGCAFLNRTGRYARICPMSSATGPRRSASSSWTPAIWSTSSTGPTSDTCGYIAAQASLRCRNTSV